jgi:hypothetical protein
MGYLQYANKINQNFDNIRRYLEAGYLTPSGRILGSADKRELVKAFCIDDQELFNAIVK